MKITAILLLIAALCTTGCYTDPKTKLGRSYHQMLASQTLNPAPATQDPVTGFDGNAAKGTMDSYGATFAPDNTINMNDLVQTMMEEGK